VKKDDDMKTTSTRTILLALALALLAGAAGCGSKTEASRANFERGMRDYLAKHGDLCIGWRRWPMDVTDAQVAAGAPDALQLPELERLGLVSSTVLPVRDEGRTTPFEVRRYRLTAKGRQSLERATHELVNPEDPTAPRRGDLCVAKVSLARVESWDLQSDAKPPTAVVSYTYGVEAPAWTADAGFRKVFPAVARLLGGAGTAQLVERFTLTADGWLANELLPGAQPPTPAAPQASAP
jgi:hypothetical protein